MRRPKLPVIEAIFAAVEQAPAAPRPAEDLAPFRRLLGRWRAGRHGVVEVRALFVDSQGAAAVRLRFEGGGTATVPARELGATIDGSDAVYLGPSKR